MQHTVIRPTICAEEMLSIEHKAQSYITPGGDDPWQLYRAFCQDYTARHIEESPFFDRCMQQFAVQFVFECGRIYGIRQERARRKASARR